MAADWPALLVIEDGEIVKSYSEADGLPGRSINTMAAFDGRIYFGVDYRRLQLVEDKGSSRSPLASSPAPWRVLTPPPSPSM